MKVGIFGGTFDPVHIGHLRVSEEVRELFALDRVYFVPVYIPPHKKDKNITDADDRLKMIRLATRGNRFFRASDIEIKRGGLSYSFDTIRFFEKKYKDLYFIIGIDAFSEIDTWYNYREIFYHTNFIIMVRARGDNRYKIGIFPDDIKGDMKKIDKNIFRHISGKKIYFHDVTQIDISSTQIRDYRNKDMSIRYLVPDSVERYIKQQGLYRG